MPEAKDVGALRVNLRRVVLEGIRAARELPLASTGDEQDGGDPVGDRERQFQAAMSDAIRGATGTVRPSPAPGPSVSAKADTNEADSDEVDDIFASPKHGDRDQAGQAGQAATLKSKPDTSGAPEKRQDRNSPEAAVKALAKSQEDVHREPERQARVVPTPKPANLSFDMVTTALNIIRSGQSMRDEHIRSEVEQYFKALKGAERVAMYSYLAGLAQILAANVPSTQAPSPDDAPNPIDMEFAQGEDQPPGDDSEHSEHSGHSRDRRQPDNSGHSASSARQQDAGRPTPDEDEPEPEDTSAPIRVGPRRR